MNTHTQNIDPAEVRKFDALASRWWDPHGDFKPLHLLNPVRLEYIQQRAELAGSRVLDVGCGGGILSEAMAESGATVTGIDMAEAALSVAQLHQKISGQEGIRYIKTSAEELATHESAGYDVVTCMEVIEHVPDPVSLVRACSQLTRPGGQIFFSTINRNLKAYALAIVAAEYVMALLPKGTHDYDRFIKPSELRRWGTAANLQFHNLSGLKYSPFGGKCEITANTDVNYLMHFSVPE